MKYRLLLLGILSVSISIGQNLYPEKFEKCNLNRFCLDCGDTKAQPPQNFVQDFVSSYNQKFLSKINGDIEAQLLVDSLGYSCLLSIKNNSNINSKKLQLQKAIDNTKRWIPAKTEGKSENVSVSLLFSFHDGKVSVQRKTFDLTKSSDFKSSVTPYSEKSINSELSESWTLFNSENSNLPWNTSRGIALDNNGFLWVGTDNGVVKMKDEKMEVYNTQNSSLKPKNYNKNETTSIRDVSVDKDNNIWFVAGWEVYKFDGVNWNIYDSLNSPIVWARTIFVDNSKNVWFTSWEGVSKYDGNKWSIIDTSNSKLPSNKVLGFYIDSKERKWIGTFDGNIRIDKTETIDFKNEDTPLGKANIAKIHEDKNGNLWFDLHNYDDMSKSGMFLLKTDGKWEPIKPKKSDLFKENTINDFLLDEENNILWIALNNIGLVKYDISKDKWETYTSKNSAVPSNYVMQFVKDKEGTIWAATFGGIIKLNKK
jgi:ligand-binding sensor domain-containing protein